MARINGQVWISREEPSVLKYYAGQTVGTQKEYWTVSASTYVAGSDIAKGMVLASSTVSTGAASELVVPAQWPRDTDRILGVALNTATAGNVVRVINYGYITFTRAELEGCFTAKSDITGTAALTGTNYYSNFGNMSTEVGAGNGWVDTGTSWKGRGANLYWFSGRTLKTGASSYSWVDSSSFNGKLTIATPSGYKPNGTDIPWSDDSLNVSYKYLPIVGNIVDYTYDGSYNITEMIVHVNFTKAQKKIQFEYPTSGVATYVRVLGGETKTLRHGLFADNLAEAGPRMPHIEISMLGYADGDITTQSNDAHRVWPGYDSTVSTSDRKTDVEIKSDSDFFYKIIGEVSYTY